MGVCACIYLWCLGWADHAPVSVVQLARPGQLPVATDGGVESAQVRECRRKCQPIQYLHMREREGGGECDAEGRKKEASKVTCTLYMSTLSHK